MEGFFGQVGFGEFGLGEGASTGTDPMFPTVWGQHKGETKLKWKSRSQGESKSPNRKGQMKDREETCLKKFSDFLGFQKKGFEKIF